MQNKFRIRICSDLDYEEMVADICYEEHTIAMIKQERGIDKMEIEIFLPEDERKSWEFVLDDFMAAIESAKQALINMQKIQEDETS